MTVDVTRRMLSSVTTREAPVIVSAVLTVALQPAESDTAADTWSLVAVDVTLVSLTDLITFRATAEHKPQSHNTQTRLRPTPVLGIGIGLIPVVSVRYRYRRYLSRYYTDTGRPLFVDYSLAAGNEATSSAS